MASTASPTFSQLGRSPSIGRPPAYTTDDLLAARNRKYVKWLHTLRIAIAAITLGASIAVIACEASSLKAFSASHLEPEWLLPLWPLNVDLRPAHTVLGCGITVAVFSLIYLTAAFIPMVYYTSPGCKLTLLILYVAAAQVPQPQPCRDHPLFPLPLRPPLHHHLFLHYHQ